jgi:intein-encoded DNA endonuclease-like protein
MKDLKTKEKFLELRAQGFSYYKIAKELKVSKQTLINWSNEFAIELDNLKTIELDKLQREYFIAKTERIKLFGKKLKVLIKEIDNRDLKDLSTEKLLDYLLKFSNTLKNEEVILTFRKEFIEDIRKKLPDYLMETPKIWLA